MGAWRNGLKSRRYSAGEHRTRWKIGSPYLSKDLKNRRMAPMSWNSSNISWQSLNLQSKRQGINIRHLDRHHQLLSKATDSLKFSKMNMLLKEEPGRVLRLFKILLSNSQWFQEDYSRYLVKDNIPLSMRHPSHYSGWCRIIEMIYELVYFVIPLLP